MPLNEAQVYPIRRYGLVELSGHEMTAHGADAEYVNNTMGLIIFSELRARALRVDLLDVVTPHLPALLVFQY